MLDLKTVPKEVLVATKLDNGNIKVFCQLNYPRVFEANPSDAKYDPDKFTVKLRIPPEVNIQALKDAAKDVATEKWKDKVKTMKLASPFKVLDPEEDFDVTGWTGITAKTGRKPGIVDDGVRDAAGKYVLIKEDDGDSVYSGRWAQVTLNAFAYDFDPKKPGVSFGLNNIRLLYHDTPLGGSGRSRAEDEFEDPAVVSASPTGKATTASDLF